MQGLTPEQQALCARLFERLITRSGTKFAMSAFDLAEPGRGIQEDAIQDVLTRLSDQEARILVPVAHPGGAPAFEIFQDVLGPPILRWKDRFEATREAVAAAGERRRRVRIRATILSVLVVLVVLAAATGLTSWQWHRAEKNLALAQSAASSLVFDLSFRLREASGVSNETIRKILDHADDLLTKLASGDTASSSMLHTRVWALIGFVETYMIQGDLRAAEEKAALAQKLAQRLVAADPKNAGWQRDLSASHDKIGDVLRAQDNLAGALESYRASLAIAERLAADNSGNAGWQRDLSVSYNKIGDVGQKRHRRTTALHALQHEFAAVHVN